MYFSPIVSLVKKSKNSIRDVRVFMQ